MTILRFPAGVRIRAIALPTEHGGWGFISEPIVLGLLLAPGWGGLALAIAALGSFLLRQPLTLFLKDVRKGRRVPRTTAALQFTLIYGGIIAVAGIAVLLMTPSFSTLLPMVMALPLIGIQLVYDSRSQGRTLTAELAGALATGAIASSIVLMQEWSWDTALTLWLALALKAAAAILYVRARLRLERGQPAGIPLALSVHVVGVIILSFIAATGTLPWTAPLALAVLSGRAALGLSPLRKSRPAKIIGFQEMGYSLTYALMIAAGYTL